VLHTIPSLLLPDGSIQLTAEKYLLALNATKFVSLLRSVNLSHYVQVPSGQTTYLPTTLGASSPEGYTILAPRDDIIDAFVATSVHANGEDVSMQTGLPPAGSKALKEILEYHIVPGRWTTEDLEDGVLLGTELRPEALGGQRQRIPVSVQRNEDDAKARRDGDRKESGVVSFAGAGIIKDPGQCHVFNPEK
jgi:hypothetical protein